MIVLLVNALLLKATCTTFSGLASLPIVREDFVLHRHAITDRQLNTAVAAGRSGPGPLGVYVVAVGYYAGGFPGAVAGTLAMITPAFFILPLLLWISRGLRRWSGRRSRSGARRRGWSGRLIDLLEFLEPVGLGRSAGRHIIPQDFGVSRRDRKKDFRSSEERSAIMPFTTGIRWFKRLSETMLKTLPHAPATGSSAP